MRGVKCGAECLFIAVNEPSAHPPLRKTVFGGEFECALELDSKFPHYSKMSTPISVGDAILLSQIALKIGRAFTSGRKSAPTEFAEIQDLLFTLSNALKLLTRDFPDDGLVEIDAFTSRESEEAQDETVLLSQMIINCRSTLTHLNFLVDKYMEIGGRNPQLKEEKRWKDEVRKNWKKIIWTKEGGDISKLKVTLIAHINGLNLAVNTVNL
jgi:hypothetical protein